MDNTDNNANYDRVTGRVLLNLLRHLKRVRNEEGELLWKKYINLCNSTITDYFMNEYNGGRCIYKDSVKNIINTLTCSEDVDMDNLMDKLDIFNECLERDEFYNIHSRSSNLGNNYILLTFLMRRRESSTSDLNNGCISLYNWGEMILGVVLSIFDDTVEAPLRYCTLYHELAHAVFTKATNSYLHAILPNITPNEITFIDEILTDIISMYVASGFDIDVTMSKSSKMVYTEKELEEVAVRVRKEFMYIYNEERL